MKRQILFSLGLLLWQAIAAQEIIRVDISRRGADVSKTMFGAFFEEINHAGDGGLYAELVMNRSFEDGILPEGFSVRKGILVPPAVKNHETGEVKHVDDRKMHWNSDTLPGWQLLPAEKATMRLVTDSPCFATAPHSLQISVADSAVLENLGFWGMNFVEGADYRLRTIIRNSKDFEGSISVRLTTQDGQVIAAQSLEQGTDWQDANCLLTAKGTDTHGKLQVVIKGKGIVWLDYVSLFPVDTYKKRENGMRRDIAEMIAGLHPSFVRWPGGTIVGGITLSTRMDWKQMLDDPASRSGQIVTWGYRNSYGLGYYEMLQFSEDIGADFMFVCNMGMGDMYRMADACSEDSIQYFIDDCLNAIEYAIGDTSTFWGARRAAAGHPQPFSLKYVELGNEHWGKEYERRFPMFYKAIKQHYPQIQLIRNEQNFRGDGVVQEGGGEDATKITNEKQASCQPCELIDPHFYGSVQSMCMDSHLFDHHPRGQYKVYVGEYACITGVGNGNMIGALAEAAFLCGMERNGDLVTMTSYAPLLENVNNRRWPVNLIRFNSSQVIGRSSYYVQKMAAENRPDYNVWNSLSQSSDSLHFLSSGIDKTTGELILKVVNCSSDTYAPLLFIDGTKQIADTGTITILTSQEGKDENTFDEPCKIFPIKQTYKGMDRKFRYDFPSHSYTVLRIPLK